MVLELSGLPEFEARRLVLEITQKLAREDLNEDARAIPSLQVQVPASGIKNKSELANLIVAEMLREIRRAS